MTSDAEQSNPERGLVLAYAPAQAREALAALLTLDEALALLLRTTREPAVGQLRLAWWREALARLDKAPAPAEPVLQGIAHHVVPRGVSGSSLVPIVHGWEVLIEEASLGPDALERFGAGRARMFTAAGEIMGAKAGDPLLEAGQGWAIADLARNLENVDEAAAARSCAMPLLENALRQRWSGRARALGAMAHLARLDLQVPHGTPVPTGAPTRVGRVLWHRLSGR